MPDPVDEPPSSDDMAEIRELLDCTRPTKFILWQDEDPSKARKSQSGVPCGTELAPRGLVHGWEVCERCIKNPSLKCALLIAAK
jgi:hypothetical protein